MPFTYELSGVDKSDAEEVGWTVVEILAEASNMSEAGKLILTLYKGMKDLGSAMDEIDEGLIPNPYFLSLGLTDVASRSKETKSYLTWRARKNFAASLFKWGGSAASTVTVVDVGTSTLGAHSLALTGVHAVKMVGLRKRYSNEEFRNYVDLCLEAKIVKATVRGTETVMAVIPGACIAAKIGVAAATAIFKIGAKVTLHKAIDRMAQLLHMHAFLERSDSGAKPATELMKEVFTRRGIGRLSQYDVPALIKEAAGWMALSDKLKLI